MAARCSGNAAPHPLSEASLTKKQNCFFTGARRLALSPGLDNLIPRDLFHPAAASRYPAARLYPVTVAQPRRRLALHRITSLDFTAAASRCVGFKS